jgi:serine protease AprX
MSKSRLFFNGIVVLMLVLTALGNSSMTAQAGNGNDELKADPRLLQMAEENPDAVFMVIVQKEAKNKDLNDVVPEVAIERSGGRVTKQLDLITSFSAELTGMELTKLAKNPKVRWISADAPMVSTAGPGMEYVRDEFKSKSYAGNNGTVAWSGNWIETGETTDPGKGAMTVATINRCSGGGGYCLRLDPDPSKSLNSSVYRQVDLSNTVSATLSFYRNNEFNLAPGGVPGTSEAVKLQISTDGGTNWTTLRTYSSTEFLGTATDTFSIAAYASSNTRIRFIITSQQSGYRFLYIDNVEIAFARPSAFLSTVKADQLSSLNGSGVTVAVIDSGITSFHPDFSTRSSSRIIASTRFGSSITTEDLYGHGTHVAGIIGGSGYASSGKYKGMASGVNLLNVKVTDDYGMTYESDVVNALQWVYDNKSTYNIRVVNLSMNSTVAQSYHTSPLAAAAEILWFNGIVVVVSAGNNGTANGPSTIYPPANDPFVITVGATEDKGTASLLDDSLAVFSAYGVTEDGFSKPDIVAPGRNVVAPLGGLLNIIYQLHPLHRVDNYYFRMSGTSMSAPVVSGAVALLLQDEPKLTPDQVKYRLMATSNIGWQGYVFADPDPSYPGYLDAYAAVNGTTTQSANTGIMVSKMLTTGGNPVTWGSVGWNSVGWNSVGWNSVGWNSVGWNSVGWNSVGWNTSTWDD